MRIIMKLVFLMSLTFALSANAWICQMCSDSRDWPNEANRCGNCGANKSKSILPSAPAPTYVQPAPYTPQPQPTQTYISSRRPQNDMSSYDGHHVHMTPLHLGAWGSYLAIPPGEYYSVYGICVNAMAVDVVDVYGLQVAYGYTIAKRDMYGLQIACGTSCGENMCGLQAGAIIAASKTASVLPVGGLFSYAFNSMAGVQIATFTRTGDLHGMQLGFWNIATSVTGLQIGAINYAERMSGVQIGAINVIKNSTVPFLPIMNMCF